MAALSDTALTIIATLLMVIVLFLARRVRRKKRLPVENAQELARNGWEVFACRARDLDERRRAKAPKRSRSTRSAGRAEQLSAMKGLLARAL